MTGGTLGPDRDDALGVEVAHEAGSPRADLRVSGEIDTATCDEFSGAIDRVVAEGATDVRIDLTGVSFMDSTGLTALIAAATKLEGRGGVVVTAASVPVRRTIEIAGLATFFAFP